MRWIRFSGPSPSSGRESMSGHLSRILEIRGLTISSVKLTRAEILPFARTPHAAPINASPANPIPMQ
jgi:hypothetical protein